MDLKQREEVQETVEVVGVLRQSSNPGKFTPDNNPAIGEWYYIDVPHMSKTAGINPEDASGFYLQAINYARNRELFEEEDLPEIPVRSAPVELIQWTIMPITHLSYSIFWFGSSLICLIFNIIVLRRR